LYEEKHSNEKHNHNINKDQIQRLDIVNKEGEDHQDCCRHGLSYLIIRGCSSIEEKCQS